SKFRVVGKNTEKMESISRPSLTYWKDAWRRMKGNRVAFFSLILIILYITLALVGPYMNEFDYTSTNVDKMNYFITSPEFKDMNLMESIKEMFSTGHWFGTDEIGRDLWTRVWMGARVSLSIGFIATIINTIVGSMVGGISGYYGGRIDSIIMRVVDVLYGIPYMIVAILIMVVLGAGVTSLILALVMVGWIGSARFVRGEVLKLKEQEFVEAAKVLGVKDRTIIAKHIIPNIMGLIITNLTMAVPRAIFAEAFLSYIGLGIAPPGCSWGVLAKAGVKLMRIYPYQLFIPAFFISTTMLALNLIGDGMRDALDPKLRNE
ncbi:MAG: ABC transporter permease, partial [Tissierellales bacterium]|nr:ABC transporter permease [Tissierellales bacterium]